MGWSSGNIEIETEDEIYFGNFENDWFEKAYHQNLCLRESCYDCKFSEFPRTGDLSIGDFWEIHMCENIQDDGKGTSVVFANTDLGKNQLHKLKDAFLLLSEIKREDLSENRIRAKIAKHPARSRFFALLARYSFTKSAEYALGSKYDIVVIGIPTVENHGSNLSYYALYRTLKHMGMEALMAERPLSAQWQPHKVPEGFRKNPYPEYDLCELFRSKYEMQKLNAYAEVFMLGSDQLWYEGLYECFDRFCFLDYIHQNKKKAAYAASFGRDVYAGTPDQRAEVQYFLHGFDEISVREDEAVELCRKEFQVESACVLDPVFLCPVEEYFELMKHADQQRTAKNAVVTYILDPSGEKEQIVDFISEQLGLPVIHMTDVAGADEKQRRWTGRFQTDIYNEDWLKYIYECDYFITDSFHGTCFGIIFKKQFTVIGNAYRGLARFRTILSRLELSDRMIMGYDQNKLRHCLEETVNYGNVDRKLKTEILKSREWLLHAAAAKDKCAVSAYDMVQKDLSRLDRQQMEMKSIVDAHGNVIGAHDARMQVYDTAFENLFQEIALHQKVLMEQREIIELLQRLLAEQKDDCLNFK